MSILVFLPGNILGKDLALRNPVSPGLGHCPASGKSGPTGSSIHFPVSAEGSPHPQLHASPFKSADFPHISPIFLLEEWKHIPLLPS